MEPTNRSKDVTVMDEAVTAVQQTNLKFTAGQVELIKSNIAVGATDNELKLFLYQCQKTGLDPLAKQCYYIKRWDASQGKQVGAIQTGIDGFRLVAQRNGDWAGTSEAVFGYGPDDPEEERPLKAKVTVYRYMHGQRIPISHTVHFAEYVQLKKDNTPTKFWKQMPHVMLGKCAEAGALRKAFPHDLSGLYTNDEMAQAKSYSAESPATGTKKATETKKAVEPLTPIMATQRVLVALVKETNQPDDVKAFLKTIKKDYPSCWTLKFLEHVINEIKANSGSAWEIPGDPDEFFNQFA